MPQQKPHVLLLINDEHRPDVLPVEGDQQVRTPTLDRFYQRRSLLSPCVYTFTHLCARHGRVLSLDSILATVVALTSGIRCLPRSELFRGIWETMAITHVRRERCTSVGKDVMHGLAGAGWSGHCG